MLNCTYYFSSYNIMHNLMNQSIDLFGINNYMYIFWYILAALIFFINSFVTYKIYSKWKEEDGDEYTEATYICITGIHFMMGIFAVIWLVHM